MRPDRCWPQWLSVPAAPDRQLVTQAGKRRVRLLMMVADHGIGQSLPRTADVPTLTASGVPMPGGAPLPVCRAVTQHLASRGMQSAACRTGRRRLHDDGGDRSQDDDDANDGRGLVSLSQLDLGRHQAAKVEPDAQRFDLGPGTLDSRLNAAMDGHQLDLALSAGRHAVERAKLDGVAVIWAQGDGAGAVTTNQVWRRLLSGWPKAFSSDEAGSTLACKDGLHRHHKRCACRLDAKGEGQEITGGSLAMVIAAETSAVDAGLILRRHAMEWSNPYEALRCLGGFEHAALVGSALAAAQLGLRWVAVGESAEIAGLLAACLNPTVEPWLRAESRGSSCACDSSRLAAESCLQYPALLALMEK